MATINLTQWEMAQLEAALRERVQHLRDMTADHNLINQTEALQRHVAMAEAITIRSYFGETR